MLGLGGPSRNSRAISGSRPTRAAAGDRFPAGAAVERPTGRRGSSSAQPAHPGMAELADARRPIRARRPRRPPRGVAGPSRAMTLTTSPSRWRSPSTSSRACRRTTPRSRAQVSGQSVTLTIPVSSSRARKTVPLAVIGCWRVTTRPPIRTGPGPPLRRAPRWSPPPAGPAPARNSVTTWRRASSPMTA